MTVLPDANSDETLDVLDAAGNVVGQAPRSEVHAKGLWHRTFHCLIVRSPSTPKPDETGAIHVLMQRRSRESTTFPGLIDLAASGHLLAGEQPRLGVRELTEETGLAVDPARLVPLGVQIIIDERPGRLNREHVHVFLLTDDRPLIEFKPNPSEVDSLVEASTSDLLALFHHHRLGTSTFTIPVTELPACAGGQVTKSSLSPADLIPDSHNYFVKVLVMAERHARGLQPIAI